MSSSPTKNNEGSGGGGLGSGLRARRFRGRRSKDDTATANDSSSPSSGGSALPPPPIIHQTTPQMPGMDSAPPSGNFNASSLPSATTVTQPLPPPPIMSGLVVGGGGPPPPPPPPPRRPKQDSSILPTSPRGKPNDIPLAAAKDLPDLTKEPDSLPITTFSPKTHSFLATRQTHHSILVIATESAHSLAWKNRLRLTDLLGGLAHDLKKDDDFSNTLNVPALAPFRSLNKSIPQQWSDLGVDFWTSSEMEELKSDACQQLLDNHAKLQPQDGNLVAELDLLEDRVDQLLQDDDHTTSSSSAPSTDLMQAQRDRAERLQQITKDAFSLTSPPNIPWLWRFRVALDHSTNHLGHEYLQCPALVLVICTTQEPVPALDCLQELSSPRYLPKAFQGATMDPLWLNKQVLVLHDNVDGPPDLVEDALVEELQLSFGPGATLLRINSISMTSRRPAPTSDLWNGGGKYGRCLSDSDRERIRNYMAGLITTSLLPALERRVSELNNVVSERKKGVRNVFKSFWRTNRDDTTSSTSSGTASSSLRQSTSQQGDGEAKYKHDSVESQVRLLADTLFLVGDYEAALSMYKLIKDDYKHDGNMLEYASVQEMMALSAYKLDHVGRAKEIFGYFETALFGYTRAAEEERKGAGGAAAGGARPSTAPRATRLATRLCLVLSSAKNMNTEGHLVVADLLASASSHETSLGAAVLLEQSSSHYYKAGMFRKYAFHMLMSGHMFRSAGQEPHAFRCFTSALYIYHDGQWEELHNHLRSALAAQLYSLGRMAVSVELYAKLVGTTGGGRVSTKSQQKFLSHLRDICRDHSKKALVGADRMAAPSGPIRRERFQRMERVIRYTPGSLRILELPNMDLPHVLDYSLELQVEAEVPPPEESTVIPFLGKTCKGEDAVWEELEILTISELRAAEKSGNNNSNTNDADSNTMEGGVSSPALAKISDPLVRAVVAEMDMENANRSLQARAKRNGTQKVLPAQRARMEPLAVSFVVENPLGVVIKIQEIQLVARLKDGERVCTNEDAIEIRLGPPPETPKEWTFQSSTNTFYAPMFARTSPEGGGEETKGAWTFDPLKPAFVVTKLNLTLKSGSKQRISLSICPLERGELEILGVRCKLFDNIWVYHPFKLQGPLLQNTRENKANRSRAEPVLLKSRIEQDMPRLTVNLVSTRYSPTEDESATLHGQVSKWNLRVSNIGTATASKLVLKTNAPWINIPTGRRRMSEDDATSTCIGPSGTLLKLGRAYECLEPGDTMEIPVQIKTTSSIMGQEKKEDLYMLYRYEFDSGTTSTKQQRWYRQMVKVRVRPAVSLTATLMPSFWAKTEHVVSVEATNHIRGKIVLDKLSIASRDYRLEKIGDQVGTGFGSGTGVAMMVDYNERVSMHYRLISTTSTSQQQEEHFDDENERPYNKCIISECPFQEGLSDRAKDSIRSEVTDFLCLESAATRFETALKEHKYLLARAAASGEDEPRHVSQIRRANTSVGDSGDDGTSRRRRRPVIHPTSVARLCPVETSKSKVDLICTWSAPNELNPEDVFVTGQNHVTGLSIRPLDATSRKGCPITITCRHAATKVHNFAAGGPAHVPCEITVRNRMVEAPVKFEFSMERPKTFEFVGAECFTWELCGGEELTIPLTAVLPKPGMYNLQHVRLVILASKGKSGTGGAQQKVSYLFPLQWMVHVSNDG